MKNPIIIFGDYYRKNHLLDPDTIDCMEYTLRSFFNEISKAFIFGCIFAFLGLFIEFFLCCLSLISIRLFAGGIHCKTYWRCFFLSFFLINICVLFPIFFVFDLHILLILSIASIVLPFMLSPVTPTFRIIKCEGKRIRLKVLASVMTLFWIICTWFYIEAYSLKTTIFLSIIISNYQLPFPFIKNALCEHCVILKKNRGD